ncbi:MAG: tetratricopeptide repeat protein [Acidobacteria bacterium]|nr:tetratricopeptide repeat protein [Acidobacteriota bacterium]
MNLLFSAVIALLGVVSAVSVYVNRNQPVIRDAPAAASRAETQLPEGHPPIDLSNRLVALEEMSRKEPQNAELKVQIGNTYYDMGQYQKAIGPYEEALKLKPQDPAVETDLATCYHNIGEHRKALQILDGVLRSHPDFPMALFNKGIVLQAVDGDVKGAIAVWERLLQTNPDFSRTADLEERIAQLKASLK